MRCHTKYSEKDFRAYVDVSSIREKGRPSLGITVEAPSANIKVTVTDPASVTVYADYEAEADVSLTALCEDRCDRYALFASVPTIRVSGPQEYVAKIHTAEAIIPALDRYEVGDQVSTSDIVLYDANGNKLSKIYFELTPGTVTVTVGEVHE